jgi:hypothetical protein
MERLLLWNDQHFGPCVEGKKHQFEVDEDENSIDCIHCEWPLTVMMAGGLHLFQNAVHFVELPRQSDIDKWRRSGGRPIRTYDAAAGRYVDEAPDDDNDA